LGLAGLGPAPEAKDVEIAVLRHSSFTRSSARRMDHHASATALIIVTKARPKIA
jgi:hypothetical protein